MSQEGPRLFEFHEGSSDKFWEITLDGTSHTVRYGRVGTDGQTKTKDFPSEDKARASYDKLIAQKTGKGYAEVAAGETSRSDAVKQDRELQKEHEPFLAAILEDPDDPAGYHVYADWLQDHGDTRGEFMSIQLQLEDESLKPADRKTLQKRESELLGAHQRDWLGEDMAAHLIDNVDSGKADYVETRFDYTFHRGFLDTLTVSYLLPTFAGILKASPHVRMLRTLTFEHVPIGGELMDEIEEYADKDWDYDDNPGFRALSGAEFDNLRSLTVRNGYDSHCNGGGVHNLIKRMPRIEEIDLQAGNVELEPIFKLKMPHLRSLTAHHLDSYPLELLAKNKSLTNLESICFFPHMLEPGDEGPYISTDGFLAICRSKNLPNLKRIELYCTEIGNDGLRELIDSGLYARLKTLNLIHGTITDEGAQLLVDAGVGHLEGLNLTGNYLTRAGVQQLEATGVNLLANDQLSGEPDGDSQEHLWHGDME